MMVQEFKAEDLKARLAEANATIEMARRALGEGQIVSLEGLEEHVDMTCQRISTLPREEGQALQPPMFRRHAGLISPQGGVQCGSWAAFAAIGGP